MIQENSPLEEFRALSRQLSDLRSVLGILTWDQETIMPTAGGTFRAGQVATVASLHHERLISDRYGDLIDEAGNSASDSWEQADVREARRLHEKAKKLPPGLVR